MGLTATDISLILEAQFPKDRPLRILTVGRLSLYLHPRDLKKLKTAFPTSRAIREYRWGDPADYVLKDMFGCQEVSSLDFSPYEGATIVHDMNLPIESILPDFVAKFDLVIDGGTLEHIYNFPVAIMNMIRLCNADGYVLTSSPANNLCGHGFYQISPELLYRVFSEENGFEPPIVLLTVSNSVCVERDRHPKSYQVVDPAISGKRLLLRNKRPTTIRALARKVSSEPFDAPQIQQSDYRSTWAKTIRTQPVQQMQKRLIRWVFDLLPHRLQSVIYDKIYVVTLGNARETVTWKGALG